MRGEEKVKHGNVRINEEKICIIQFFILSLQREILWCELCSSVRKTSQYR